MITLIHRENGKEIQLVNRRDIMAMVYSPIAIIYQLNYSKIMQEAIEYYKDVPLTEHEITESEKRKLAENPDYALDIPKWEIKGYDDFVSNERLERRLTAEFYGRFMSGDRELIKMINAFHPVFKAR